MPNWKKVITSGSSVQLNHISASGNIGLENNKKIYFTDTGTYIQGNSTQLILESDNQLITRATNRINFDTPLLGINIGTTTPPKELTVFGSISASGNLSVQGDISASGDFYSNNTVHFNNSLNVTGSIYVSDDLYFENEENIFMATVGFYGDSAEEEVNALGRTGADILWVGSPGLGHPTTISGDGLSIYLSGSRFGIGTPGHVDTIPKELTVFGSISASGATFTDKLIVGTSGTNSASNAIELTVKGDISASGRLYINDSTAQVRIGDNVAGGISGIAVNGDITASGDLYLDGAGKALRFTSPSAGVQYIKFGDGESDNSGQIYYSHATDKMRISTLSTIRLHISQSGGPNPEHTVIGIGTSTPTKTLQVHGSISASGALYIHQIRPTGSSIQIVYGLPGDPGVGRHSFFVAAADASAFSITSNESLPADFNWNADQTRLGIGPNIGTTATKTLTVDGDISASGDIYLQGNQYLRWPDADGSEGTNTSIQESSGILNLYADNSIYLRPDENIVIIQGSSEWARFDGDDRQLRVTGSISASGELQVGSDASADVHQFTGSVYLSGDTGNGQPIWLIDNAGNSGEFWHYRNAIGETVVKFNQGAAGGVRFSLFGSEDSPAETHRLDDASIGAPSWVNYSADSSSINYFGIGTNNPDATLHLSGTFHHEGDIIGSTQQRVSFGGPNTSSTETLVVEGDISASGNIYLENDGQLISRLSDGAETNLITLNTDDTISYGASVPIVQSHTFLTRQNSTALFITASGASTPKIGIGTRTPTKTLTVAGDISASGTYYGKQFYYTHHGWNKDGMGAVYIPINTYYDASTINYYRHWIAPFDGQLSKVIIYPEFAAGTVRVLFYKNGTARETISAVSPPATTSTTWNFTSTSTFSAGDRLAIKYSPMIPGTSGFGDTTATCVWLYDTST